MGRWADALHAHTATHDTADTADTSPAGRGPDRGSVRCVNSVNGFGGVLAETEPPARRREVSVVSAVSCPRETEIAAEPIDLGTLPCVCPVCGRGLWWRLSIVSGGPGPWSCLRCVAAPSDVWIDGYAVPLAETLET